MTLLIVEDEDIIRKGLIITLRKLQMDFECIYEAGNGADGLRLCQDHSPDIIITDIKMPRMDGLAFIRESQKGLPNSQYIILSGYSDFEYARTALKFGVRDYLLKPSTKSEIKEVLTRVIGEFMEKQSLQLKLSDHIHSYERKLSRYQEFLLGSLLLGRGTPGDAKTFLARYSISFPEERMAVLCIKITLAGSFERLFIDYKKHFAWIESLIKPYAYVYQADIASGYKCLVLNMPRKEPAASAKIWRTIEDGITEYESLHGLRIRLSVSEALASREMLPSLYQEACKLLHYRLFLPDSIIFDSKRLKKAAASPPAIPLTMIKTLYHSFIGSSQFDLHQYFYNFLHHITHVADSSPSFVFDCLGQLEESFAIWTAKEEPDSASCFHLHFFVYEIMAACDSLESLTDTLYHRLLDAWKLRKKEVPAICLASSPVDQAIAYMEENYYKDLDLGMISNLISMNSSYFSSLFKKKTGLNLIHYLQNVRIEKSKQLLLHTNQKLYEISEAVGIPNVKYFCKLFKDYTGITPSEFRKKEHASR